MSTEPSSTGTTRTGFPALRALAQLPHGERHGDHREPEGRLPHEQRADSSTPGRARPPSRPAGHVRHGRAPVRRSPVPARPSSPSDLEQFGFLVLEQVVDLVDVGAGSTSSSSFSARVTSSSPTSPSRASRSSASLALTADVADRHPGVLGLLLRDLDVLPASLLGELREDDAQDLAVVVGVDAQVGVPDRPLDRRQ